MLILLPDSMEKAGESCPDASTYVLPFDKETANVAFGWVVLGTKVIEECAFGMDTLYSYVVVANDGLSIPALGESAKRLESVEESRATVIMYALSRAADRLSGWTQGYRLA